MSTTENDQGLGGRAGDLLAAIVQSNVDQVKSITDLLMESYKAEAEWLRDGVDWALSTSEFGGTTREYEGVLARVQAALYPSEEIKDYYREQARRFVRGESDVLRDRPHPAYDHRQGPA